MKLLITFLLLTGSAFAKTTVNISEIGNILQNEMNKVSTLSANLNSVPATKAFDFSGFNSKIIVSFGVCIPEIASATIDPEIEFYFEK